jgi:hypothetical protein
MQIDDLLTNSPGRDQIRSWLRLIAPFLVAKTGKWFDDYDLKEGFRTILEIPHEISETICTQHRSQFFGGWTAQEVPCVVSAFSPAVS